MKGESSEKGGRREDESGETIIECKRWRREGRQEIERERERERDRERDRERQRESVCCARFVCGLCGMGDVVWCMLYLVRVVLSARSYDCNPRVLTKGRRKEGCINLY